MAAPLFNSTLAPANNSVLEIRKGLFDLLKKIQAVSDYLDEQIGGNEGELTPTGSPTFAEVITALLLANRVITPRVDNDGANLKINPLGGNISIGQDADLGKRLGIKANNGETVHCTFNGNGFSTYEWGIDADGDGFLAVKNKTGSTLFDVNGNGYTRLGADASAPAIKMKELAGTTASTQGGVQPVAHSLNSDKILSVDVVINYTGSSYIGLHHKFSAGYEADMSFDTTNVNVINMTANSANILSKPFKIIITYKE